jgi:hypothetical protein
MLREMLAKGQLVIVWDESRKAHRPGVVRYIERTGFVMVEFETIRDRDGRIVLNPRKSDRTSFYCRKIVAIIDNSVAKRTFRGRVESVGRSLLDTLNEITLAAGYDAANEITRTGRVLDN